LDVGAGDGRVFKAIKDIRPGYHFCIDEKYGIEKARAQSDDLIRKGVFIIGRDFFQTTLIDKEFAVIYSNPPYSIYVSWTLRLLKEASFRIMYLLLPVRWETNKEILQELERYEYTIIGTFDFLQGDRAARARVNLIRITRKTVKIDNQDYMQDAYDPFVRWIEENIGVFEDASKEPDYVQEEKWLKASSENPIEELVEQYNYEMTALIEGFKAIGKLPGRVINSIGLNKESIMEIIKQNIKSLKTRFWITAFNKIDPITERLTKDTREELIEKMKQFKGLDFNVDNIYSIIIWVIENFNRYTDEQTVTLFGKLTSAEYIKAYKSNRHWDKDTWRYDRASKENPYTGEKGKGKPERYILDYRFVTASRRGQYTYDGYSIVEDIIIVLRSLGANINKKWHAAPEKSGELQRIMMNNNGKSYKDDIALECRFYQNGNVHVKINQELMMKFNIEVARILGWIRGPQDIQDEFDVNEAEAVRYWNTNSLVKIGMSDVQMLEYKGA
jgi:hypothetical protein